MICDCRLDCSEYWEKWNTNLVHTIYQRERWAGIYEKAPSSDKALGGFLGLAINCACAALYMVLHYPTVTFGTIMLSGSTLQLASLLTATE